LRPRFMHWEKPYKAQAHQAAVKALRDGVTRMLVLAHTCLSGSSNKDAAAEPHGEGAFLRSVVKEQTEGRHRGVTPCMGRGPIPVRCRPFSTSITLAPEVLIITFMVI
jgi:hypothetical protein